MLEYTDRTGWRLNLGWQLHSRGLELRAFGPGFAPGGFSLGVYSQRGLQVVLEQLRTVDPYDRPPRVRRIYTFTHPVKYACGQGRETRLAIHGEVWSHLEISSPALWSVPLRYLCTATVHEQGERTPWRWLGRYSLRNMCCFLEAAVAEKPAEAVQ